MLARQAPHRATGIARCRLRQADRKGRLMRHRRSRDCCIALVSLVSLLILGAVVSMVGPIAPAPTLAGAAACGPRTRTGFTGGTAKPQSSPAPARSGELKALPAVFVLRSKQCSWRPASASWASQYCADLGDSSCRESGEARNQEPFGSPSNNAVYRYAKSERAGSWYPIKFGSGLWSFSNAASGAHDCTGSRLRIRDPRCSSAARSCNP